jgi:hypothetical protein
MPYKKTTMKKYGANPMSKKKGKAKKSKQKKK